MRVLRLEQPCGSGPYQRGNYSGDPPMELVGTLLNINLQSADCTPTVYNESYQDGERLSELRDAYGADVFHGFASREQLENWLQHPDLVLPALRDRDVRLLEYEVEPGYSHVTRAQCIFVKAYSRVVREIGPHDEY